MTAYPKDSWPREIGPGVPGDLDAILALERATDTAPHWPSAAYADILADAGTSGRRRCLFVAITHGRGDPGASLSGFAVGMVPGYEPPAPGQSAGSVVAELETIVVAASARRRGIGRDLCVAVINWCRAKGAEAMELEVRAMNRDAIALYEKLGLKEAGRRPRYYRDPDDDALLFRLEL